MNFRKKNCEISWTHLIVGRTLTEKITSNTNTREWFFARHQVTRRTRFCIGIAFTGAFAPFHRGPRLFFSSECVSGFPWTTTTSPKAMSKWIDVGYYQQHSFFDYTLSSVWSTWARPNLTAKRKTIWRYFCWIFRNKPTVQRWAHQTRGAQYRHRHGRLEFLFTVT